MRQACARASLRPVAQTLLIEDTALGPMAALVDGKDIRSAALPFAPPRPQLGLVAAGRVTKRISGARDCLVTLYSGPEVHLSARRGAGAKHISEGVQVRVQIVREASDGKLAEASTKIRLRGRYGMLVSSFRGVQNVGGKPCTRPIMVPTGWGLSLTAAADDVPDAAIAAECIRLEEGGLLPVEAAIAALPARFSGQIIVSGRNLWAQRGALWQERYPDLAGCFTFEDAPNGTLFEAGGVTAWLRGVEAGHRVLPGGGDIRFGTLHGITVLDVNAGKALPVGGARAVNIAAADTLGPFLQAAQIGGLCLVDFIDMDAKGDAKALHAALDRALAGDKDVSGRTDLSRFGCIELRRRKTGPSLPDRLQAEPLLDGIEAANAAIAAAPANAHGTLHLRLPPPLAAWAQARMLGKHLEARLMRPSVITADETLAPGMHDVALKTEQR